MSSSIFCEGCYGYQNMVPKYPKRLFQTILISGCKCLDSTPTVKIPLAGAGSGNKQSLFMCTHSVHFSLLSKPIAFSCSNNKCIKPEGEPDKNAACTGTSSLWLDVLGHCRSWGAKGAVLGGLEEGRVQNAPHIRQFKLLWGLWSQKS